MNFNYLKVGTLALSVILFTGCASSLTTKIDTPISQITADKSKSYITFARPQTLGAALSNTVIEFDPSTKETKLVGTLGSYDRIIYETNPGTHFFYMSGGENDDMIKVSTDSSKMYYVATQVQFGLVAGRFYFKPIKSTTFKSLTLLKDSECTDEIIEKYGFEKHEGQVDTFEQYKSNSLNVIITCNGGKVSNINNLNASLDEIEESDIIKPNEKAYIQYKENLKDYTSEINEDFDEWLKEDSKETEMKKEDGFFL